MISKKEMEALIESMEQRLTEEIDERFEEYLEKVRDVHFFQQSDGQSDSSIVHEGSSNSSIVLGTINPRLGMSNSAIDLFKWVDNEGLRMEFMWRYTQMEYARAAEDWVQCAAYLVMIIDGLSQHYLLPLSVRTAQQHNSKQMLGGITALDESQLWTNWVTGEKHLLKLLVDDFKVGWSFSRPTKLFVVRGLNGGYWRFSANIMSDNIGYYTLVSIDDRQQEVRIKNQKAIDIVMQLEIDGIFFPEIVLDTGEELELTELYFLLSSNNDFRRSMISDRVVGRLKTREGYDVTNWARSRVEAGSFANVYRVELSSNEKYLNLKAPYEQNSLTHEINISDYQMTKRFNGLCDLVFTSGEKKEIRNISRGWQRLKRFRDGYCHTEALGLGADYSHMVAKSTLEVNAIIEQVMRHSVYAYSSD